MSDALSFEEILNEAKDTSEYIESVCFEKECISDFDLSKIEFKDMIHNRQ